MRQKEKGTNDNVPHHALETPGTLSHITRYLCLSDLKSFRQLNSQWLQASNQHYIRRSQAKFTLQQMEKCWGPELAEFYNYLYNCLKYKHQNFHIGTSYGYRCRDNKILDFLERMEYLFIIVGGQVKSLNLDWRISYTTWEIVVEDWKKEFDFLNHLLILVPHLEELHLRLCVDKQRWEIFDSVWFPRCDIVLPSVKKLKLEIGLVRDLYESDVLDEQKLSDLCHKLITLTPSITSLHFYNSSGTVETTFLEQMVSMSTYQNPIFPNLDSLLLSRPEPVGLKKVLLLSNKLRKIHFGFLDMAVRGSKLVPLVDQVLSSHAKSLEAILMKVYPGRAKRTITIPRCPKLTTLQIQIVDREADMEARGALLFEDIVNLRAIMELGPVLFKKMFPKLTSLRIDGSLSNPFNLRPTLNDGFFPTKEHLEFRQFTQLDLCYPMSLRFGLEYSEWIARLARMFPNVHNWELTYARAQLMDN